jgi:hypothetical protein
MHDLKLQKDYARRLDEACKGLSHRAVGELLGLPGETVRRYRKGLSPVPLYVAGELCGKLGISPSRLIIRAGPRRSAADVHPGLEAAARACSHGGPAIATRSI